MKCLFLCILLFPAFLFQVFFASFVYCEEGCEQLDLKAIIETLDAKSPVLASARHEVEAEKALIEPAGTLPDPILGVGVINLPTDTFSIDQEAMTQTQLKLTQRVPYPGKLAIKKDIQSWKVEVANWRLEETRLTLQKEAKTLFWELFLIDSTLKLLEKERQTLDRIVELTTSKYEAGRGLQSDVLLAQLELTKLLNKKVALEAKREDILHQLKDLLGIVDQCVEIEMPSDVHIPALAPLDEMRDEAFKGNPGIRELEAVVKMKRRAYELTKTAFYPDFTITGAYGKRFGENPNGSDRADFATLSVSINLPIFFKKKQSLEVVSSLEQVKSAEERLLAKKNRISEQLKGKYGVYIGLLEQDRIFRDSILPKARSTLEALKAAYASGRADIVGLLKAELMLYRFEEAHIDVISRANKVLAALQAMVGREI